MSNPLSIFSSVASAAGGKGGPDAPADTPGAAPGAGFTVNQRADSWAGSIEGGNQVSTADFLDDAAGGLEEAVSFENIWDTSEGQNSFMTGMEEFQIDPNNEMGLGATGGVGSATDVQEAQGRTNTSQFDPGAGSATDPTGPADPGMSVAGTPTKLASDQQLLNGVDPRQKPITNNGYGTSLSVGSSAQPPGFLSNEIAGASTPGASTQPPQTRTPARASMGVGMYGNAAPQPRSLSSYMSQAGVGGGSGMQLAGSMLSAIGKLAGGEDDPRAAIDAAQRAGRSNQGAFNLSNRARSVQGMIDPVTGLPVQQLSPTTGVPVGGITMPRPVVPGYAPFRR